MHVLLVSPTLQADEALLLQALLSRPHLRVGVLTNASVDRLPDFARGRLTVHLRLPSLLDGDALAAAIRKVQEHGPVDRVLAALEKLQVPVAYAREATGVPGLAFETALNFRDKHRMKAILAAAGLPVARQALLGTADDGLAFLAAVGGAAVLKPRDGVGSQGTIAVHDEAGLRAALHQLRASPEQPVQAEEFIQGEERSFESVLVDGDPVWASCTHYHNRPLDVVEHAWMQWCVVLPKVPLDPVAEAFRPLNTAALQALGLRTGLAHMEWFVRPDGSPVISEVGARPPGASFMTMLRHAHDDDPWTAWAGLMTGAGWSLAPRQRAVGCAYLRGQGQGDRIVALHGLDVAQRAVGEHVVDRRLPVVGAPHRPGYEGDGWAIVAHPDEAVVRRALGSLVTTVRVQLG